MTIDRCLVIRLLAWNCLANVISLESVDLLGRHLSQHLVSIQECSDHLVVISMIACFLSTYLRHAPHKDVVLRLMGQYNMLTHSMGSIKASSSKPDSLLHLASLLHLVHEYVKLNL